MYRFNHTISCNWGMRSFVIIHILVFFVMTVTVLNIPVIFLSQHRSIYHSLVSAATTEVDK